MPIRPLCAVLAVAGAQLLSACSETDAPPPAAAAQPAEAVDPVAGTASDTAPAGVDVPAGPHEISLVADFGPLPDGSGNAVVESTWTTDADGTVRFTIDTPAGLAEQHVLTEDEHWWWLNPEVRRTIADAEWVHFDLRAIAEAGGELPDVVAEARQLPPQPGQIAVGDLVAGREVLAVEDVAPEEVLLTIAGIERPVLHRRRSVPAGTTVDLPAGAVDVRDLPDVLRW